MIDSKRPTGRFVLAAMFMAGSLALAVPSTVFAADATTAPAASSGAAPAKMAPARTSTSAASRTSRIEARISSLHSRLKITSAQEQAWQAVATQMRSSAQKMGDLAAARMAKAKTMNAVDDLSSYADIAAARADDAKNLVPAFQTLYNSMSDGQKKTADALFRGRPRNVARKTTAAPAPAASTAAPAMKSN